MAFLRRAFGPFDAERGQLWCPIVLINVGTSLLLLAPLFYLQQVLEEKVDVLDAELRGRVRGLAALKDALPSGPARTSMIDAFLSAAREPSTAGRGARSSSSGSVAATSSSEPSHWLPR